jgi:hypothetical protein
MIAPAVCPSSSGWRSCCDQNESPRAIGIWNKRCFDLDANRWKRVERMRRGPLSTRPKLAFWNVSLPTASFA